jgi:hypothetical protein
MSTLILSAMRSWTISRSTAAMVHPVAGLQGLEHLRHMLLAVAGRADEKEVDDDEKEDEGDKLQPGVRLPGPRRRGHHAQEFHVRPTSLIRARRHEARRRRRGMEKTRGLTLPPVTAPARRAPAIHTQEGA